MVTRRSLMAGMTALSASRILGANDRVRVGLLGAGGRGTYAASRAKEFGNADIAALADIYQPRIDSARASCTGDGRGRRLSVLLDRKDLDAVIVGAPDHWHVPMTIAAVQAGKDVYVEKPLTHSVEEGRAVIDAVARSGRIVQVGYQQRSYPGFPASQSADPKRPDWPGDAGSDLVEPELCRRQARGDRRLQAGVEAVLG